MVLMIDRPYEIFLPSRLAREVIRYSGKGRQFRIQVQSGNWSVRHWSLALKGWHETLFWWPKLHAPFAVRSPKFTSGI
jgi:hypothetical protein